jgi:hypothetical protein
MKGTVVLLAVFALATVAMLMMSGFNQQKFWTDSTFQSDITTDKNSYVPTDTVRFTIRLLEQSRSTGQIAESDESFTVKIYRENSITVVATLTGKSPLTCSYPAANLQISDYNAFKFIFSGAADMRSMTDYHDVPVAQTVQIDTTPPSLESYGATLGSDPDVSVDTQIGLIFSEPVQTLTSGNIQLTDADSGAGIPASILQTGRQVIMTPSVVQLEYLTHYSVALSGVKDLTGNAMSDFSWSFRTTGDGTPPVVNITYPVAVLKEGFDLRQADVYDVSYPGARMANMGVAHNNVLTVSGSAQDYGGVSSISCKNDANGEVRIGTGGSHWSVDITLVPENNNNFITVFAKDPSGNVGQDRIVVHYGTGGLYIINVTFDQPASIGPKGNGGYSTDKQEVNVSGHVSYSYRDIVKVSWHNNLTDESGTVWAGSSHEVNWNFTSKLVKGENPIWVAATDSKGFTNYGAFTAVCTYTPPIPATPKAPGQPGISAISVVGAAALILILAGLFLRFIFDFRFGWIVSGIGFVLLVIFLFITMQQPPM